MNYVVLIELLATVATVTIVMMGLYTAFAMLQWFFDPVLRETPGVRPSPFACLMERLFGFLIARKDEQKV